MYHVWHLMAHFSFTTAITYNMYHVWHLLAYFSRVYPRNYEIEEIYKHTTTMSQHHQYNENKRLT
jgi:hypothetical protein